MVYMILFRRSLLQTKLRQIIFLNVLYHHHASKAPPEFNGGALNAIRVELDSGVRYGEIENPIVQFS